MNRTKKIAKILTSLQERSIKTKMSKDDQHMTIDVMSRGKDGKKGTGDDKSMRKNKIKVRGDHSPHPVTHKYKAEALELGTNKTTKKYKKDTPGQEVKEGSSDTTDMYKLMIKGMKAMPGSPKQKEIIKQINVIRKRLGMKPMSEEIKEASEWEEAVSYTHLTLPTILLV